MEGINILRKWVSCFTCIYSKIIDPDEISKNHYRCTHGWKRNFRGSYQRLHISRKCKQHKYKRRIGEKI